MPCSVRLLKTTPASFDFYDFDEYGRLVTTAAKVDVMTLLIVSLGGDAGLRAAEMRALRWIDVDKGQLRVERDERYGTHISAWRRRTARFGCWRRRGLETFWRPGSLRSEN